MRKGIIVFLILAFVIPALMAVAKFTVKPKQLSNKALTQEVEQKASDISPQKNEPNKSHQSTPDMTQITIVDGPRLIPVDEAGQNEDFKSFRDRLGIAVEKKDISFLKKHIDKDIHYSFGAEPGMNGFLEEWGLNINPDESKFWVALGEVIRLGGSFTDKDTFTAPYVFSKFPDRFDAYEYIAIIDKEVNVYSKPDLTSKVIAKLTYNIVKKIPREQQTEEDSWEMVEFSSKNQGYVEKKFVRSSIDYRASFVYSEGTWKLKYFVAGD